MSGFVVARSRALPALTLLEARMFRHVVLLRFVDESTPEQHEAIVAALRGLPAQIPELRSYQVGRDHGLAPTNFDLAVVADCDDVDGYLVYRDHPAHRQVIDELITPILADRAAVQHEGTP